MKTNKQLWKEILFGVAVADAIGVPREFTAKKKMKDNPCTDMEGNGTYNLPMGTWSDDTALSLCLAEAFTYDGDLPTNTANLFVQWLYGNLWTPRGTVFDVGNSTRAAIARYKKTNIKPELAGGTDASDNGNGSLMRILPLLMHTKDMPVSDRFEWTKKISSITHAHIRSVIGCFYYLEYARLLISGQNKYEAYKNLQGTLPGYLKNIQGIEESELQHYDRLFNKTITDFEESEIFGNGYVVNSLEAAMWCFLKGRSYREVVLLAVNLGEDTDTTAAIAGGLAALHYEYEDIPAEWLKNLARKDDIDNLIDELVPFKQYNYTPEIISALEEWEVFVFGSNSLGEHFGGAARVAHRNFGAIWGEGEGLFGQSYAFPTLSRASTVTGPTDKEVLQGADLEISFKNFFDTIELYPEKQFLFTKVGTGIAGIPIETIKNLFHQFYKPKKHKNITFPVEFK